jgi:hypothetical protein
MTDIIAPNTSGFPYPQTVQVRSSPARPEDENTASPVPPGASPPAEPRLCTKLLFWFILSALSVFFAEVVSGSSPFPFLSPFDLSMIWGWCVLMPLYGLHTLVLASVVFNWGRPRFYAIFLAGVIFGLYEAYITKVLWGPPWGAPIISAGGVAVVELAVLALFWHPFMSFAVPLSVAETVLTSSRDVIEGFPDKVKALLGKRGPALFLLFPLWAGLNHGGAGIVAASLSALISMVFLLALTATWKNLTAPNAYPLRSLLPNRKQTGLLAVMLAILYVVLGAGIYPQRIPGIAAQAPILMMYAAVIGLLLLAVLRSRTDNGTGTCLQVVIGWKHLMMFSAIFTVASALSGLLGLSLYVLVITWFPAVGIGVGTLVWSAREALRRPGTEALSPGQDSQS